MTKIQCRLSGLFLIFWVSCFAQMESTDETITSSASLSCDASSSSFMIQGTSSLHDWEMTSQSCKGMLELDLTQQTLNIKDIELMVQVTSLKSGKKIMDKKCYDALKCEDYPNIIYKFITIKNLQSQGANNYNADLEGTLNIAGVKKPLNIQVEILQNNGMVTIKGSKAVKMSDFNVEPPKALLGTLKTGNEITIIFNLNFVEL